MCFVLYVGTRRPLSRRKFDNDSADLPVESLTERDAAIQKHFSSPEVQYVGSSSGCGCDFPYATFQGCGWPQMDYQPEGKKDEFEIARENSERRNCEALAALLRTTGDNVVELYGVWDGDFANAPRVAETISIARLVDAGFRFKEQGFYRVVLEP